MDENQRRKLERYLKNSRQFLWGFPPYTQRKNYEWLEEKGFTKANYTPTGVEKIRYSGTYPQVLSQLLLEHGMGKIIEELVIPEIIDRFVEDALSYLQRCWREGTTPDIFLLKKYGVKKVAPLLEGDLENNTLVGWTEFAGLWFEEIEPLRKQTKNDKE